ncbi:MAG: hypothetical protein WAJ92_09225 [Candidatus Acidiferrales bacterium]
MKDMTRNSLGKFLALPALVFGLVAVVPARAQNSQPQAKRVSAKSAAYNVADEITIQGTIEKIAPASDVQPAGTRLLISTLSGIVNVDLGALNAPSLKALDLSVGDSIELTGIQRSGGASAVFLARLLTTSSRVVILRNEHGLPIRSVMPRGNSSSQPVMKGGL